MRAKPETLRPVPVEVSLDPAISASFDIGAAGADIPAVTRSRAKRWFDMIAAALLLVALSPLFLVIGLAIVIESGWPPLYLQTRYGLGGRPFEFWKFRTMVNGAHEMRSGLLAANEAPFPAFKVRFDPRATRLGRFLRRSSLDELPQLWNVLQGEMSLVGPRPPLPEEVRFYDETSLRRLRARPGLTGVWQVENRNRSAIAFAEWVRMDLDYIANWSWRLDLELLGRTVLAVLRMTGT